MDNFNMKKYLVENKLTYQEKMKEKAKKINEEPFVDFTHGNPLDVAQGAARMEIKKRVDKALQDLYNVTVDLRMLDRNIPNRWEGLGEKVKQLSELKNEIQMILNKDSSFPLEEETTGKGKDKEKEEPKKAPKDKSKQGPSTMNEAEQSKIEKYIGYLESYENAITQLQRTDADYISNMMNVEFGSDKEIGKKAKELCKTTQDQKIKKSCERAKLLESKTLNESKVFFGGY